MLLFYVSVFVMSVGRRLVLSYDDGLGGGAGAGQSSQPLIRRAWTVYSVYGQRGDAFEPVRTKLPTNANPLGLVTSDDPETSLWRPFGSRSILHVTRTDTAEDLQRLGIQYVLIS